MLNNKLEERLTALENGGNLLLFGLFDFRK